MKLKSLFLTSLVTVFCISGAITVNAATISDDGKYSLLLSADEWEPTFDGEYAKLIRFNVAEGETTVNLSELTKGITPFNGKNEFSHWETSDNVKADEELALSDFTKEGYFYLSTGEEIKYDKGLTLKAKFEGKPLNETGNYYVTLDAFGGTVNGKAQLLIESKKEEFKTIDLTQYTPVREGLTFKGWDLNGEFVTSVDSSAFAKDAVVNLTATYTADTFDDKYMSVILDANGGTIDGKPSNKYNYLGGGNSGTSMSLLPYVPVREGYTFTGWNSKSDGSGENCKYIYWRVWDKNEETDKEFDKDTLIKEDSGYERYKYVTLYATWTKNPDTPSDYTMLDGANGTWTQNSDDTLTFRASGSIDKFTGVKIDDTLVDAKNYTAVSGSTIISLKADYVNTLSVGKHTITVLYTDGECKTNFEIKAQQNSDKPSDPSNTDNNNKPQQSNTEPADTSNTSQTGTDNSPKTGDNNNFVLWLALIAISGGIFAGSKFYSQKRHNER